MSPNSILVIIYYNINSNIMVLLKPLNKGADSIVGSFCGCGLFLIIQGYLYRK